MFVVRSFKLCETRRLPPQMLKTLEKLKMHPPLFVMFDEKT
jgi:hypothetical protein